MCGAIEARARTDARRGAAIDQEHALITGRPEIIDGPGWWLVRGVKLTKAGVNANRQLKTSEAIVDSVGSLEGTPIVYDHPPGRVLYDPLLAAGFAVDARLGPGPTAVHDALLFKARPPGYRTSDLDLERNARLVEHVRGGGQVHVSPGYFPEVEHRSGYAPGQGGALARFDEVQTQLRYNHVAILRPFVGKDGSCPTWAGCGFGVDSMQKQQSPPEPGADAFEELDGKTLRAYIDQEVRASVDECAKRHLSKEKTAMNDEQLKAAIDAAASKGVEAVLEKVKPAVDAAGKLPELQKQLDATKSQVDELQKALKAQADSAKAEADKAYGETLNLVARARVGNDAAKVKAEEDRLRGIFPTRASIDEYAATVLQPGHVDPLVLRGPPDPALAESGVGENPDGSYSVRDWSKFKPTNPTPTIAPKTKTQGAN